MTLTTKTTSDSGESPQDSGGNGDRGAAPFLDLACGDGASLLIETARIRHKRWDNIIRKLEYCRTWSKGATDPYCMMVLGESGTGKSAVVAAYMQRHKVSEEEEGQRIPVLKVDAPAVPTMKSLAESMLFALGDPLADKGTLNARTDRLIRLLKRCGVEIIIVDEFQHFLEHESAKSLQSTSDWLKNLITQSRLPVVLVGLEKCGKILESYPQLDRRFMAQAYLKPFRWHEAKREEFFHFLSELDDQLPLREKSGLSDPEMAQRLFFASKGLVSSLMKIVRQGAHIAIELNEPRITAKSLSKAYKLTTARRIKPDPFLGPLPEIDETWGKMQVILTNPPFNTSVKSKVAPKQAA
ncbi:TniB family NTP-binding protein [Ferrovibrio sp.]|uniref:TniB family NTP-binding protein n=1 Tax=Ferrovibrio sp. TaxID=1917215 RepID=UPI003518FE8D